MKLEKITMGLAISVFALLVQNQEALAERVTINEEGDNPSCKSDKSCFLPSNMMIQQGQDVVWYNDDSSIHSIITQSQQFGSSGIINSGNILPGESYSHRFDESGYVNYYCVLHPWMQGLVVVQ
ncbi:MAG TPA: plastocyanin/azurin family copper-binding protein [Nitrosopumilaceae archaeon]|nr:plastocyanin/azurin family copper-binding protein [Nitrosopumilaceae archaeon]